MKISSEILAAKEFVPCWALRTRTVVQWVTLYTVGERDFFLLRALHSYKDWTYSQLNIYH